jgi:hypothetical protein
MTDTGAVENPQPAIRGPQAGGQPPRRPPAAPGATRPPGSGPRPPAGAVPGQQSQGTDWAAFVESCRQLADRIASIRQVRWIRKSSASVRWALLVVAVGLGSALLVALTIDLLVSLIPRSG